MKHLLTKDHAEIRSTQLLDYKTDKLNLNDLS